MRERHLKEVDGCQAEKISGGRGRGGWGRLGKLLRTTLKSSLRHLCLFYYQGHPPFYHSRSGNVRKSVTVHTWCLFHQRKHRVNISTRHSRLDYVTRHHRPNRAVPRLPYIARLGQMPGHFSCCGGRCSDGGTKEFWKRSKQ